MNGLLITAALLATVPQDTVLRDRCCCLEVNSFYDSEGQLVFKQLLVLDFRPRKGVHQCEDWRLIKNRDQQRANIVVRRDYQTGEYVARWDEDSGPREVRAVTYRETFGQADPELVDRDKHPVNERRKLWSGKAVEP
jgi:hypothetical protein